MICFTLLRSGIMKRRKASLSKGKKLLITLHNREQFLSEHFPSNAKCKCGETSEPLAFCKMEKVKLILQTLLQASKMKCLFCVCACRCSVSTVIIHNAQLGYPSAHHPFHHFFTVIQKLRIENPVSANKMFYAQNMNNMNGFLDWHEPDFRAPMNGFDRKICNELI